jgi:hypothetical protein
MTGALTQAAEALRDGQDCAKLAREAWNNGTFADEYVKGAFEAMDEALVAIEAEQARIPSDRERLARQLTTEAAIMEMGGTGGLWAKLMREAAAALRAGTGMAPLPGKPTIP